MRRHTVSYSQSSPNSSNANLPPIQHQHHQQQQQQRQPRLTNIQPHPQPVHQQQYSAAGYQKPLPTPPHPSDAPTSLINYAQGGKYNYQQQQPATTTMPLNRSNTGRRRVVSSVSGTSRGPYQQHTSNSQSPQSEMISSKTPSSAATSLSRSDKQWAQCDQCQKKYKNHSCLSKHVWEHHSSWKYAKKLMLTKHQSVQIMEAAQVLINIVNPQSVPQQTTTTAVTSRSMTASISSQLIDKQQQKMPTLMGTAYNSDEDDLMSSNSSTTSSTASTKTHIKNTTNRMKMMDTNNADSFDEFLVTDPASASSSSSSLSSDPVLDIEH